MQRFCSPLIRTVLMLTLLACLCVCAPALADSLSGCAYVDANANMVCDEGEQLITGVPLRLDRRAADGWSAVAQTETDEYGRYAFADLEQGVYRVVCTLTAQQYHAATVGASALMEDGLRLGEEIDLAGDHTQDIGLRASAQLDFIAFKDGNLDGKRGNYDDGVRDVLVEVLDGDGVVAAGTTAKKGTLTLYVPDGDYALRITLPDNYGFSTRLEGHSIVGDTIEGVAISDPLHFVAGEVTAAMAGMQPVGSLGGKVFEDINNNGVMDEDEPGAAGVTLHAVGKKNGVRRDITTDETGVYCFERLPDDTYTITATLPDGMLFARYSKTGGDLRSIFTGETLERDFPVRKSSNVTDKNVGVVQNGVISGTAFMDLNYDGYFNEGEPGYAGVTLEAVRIATGESWGRTVTDEEGLYRLENLRSGDYRLRAILPDDGTVFSVTVEGDPAEGNRFEQRATRREFSIEPVNVSSGGESTALVGVARGATVSGTVFEDADYTGVYEGSEKLLSGLKVYAVDADGLIAAEATTQKGAYTLKGLMPGTYRIHVQRKPAYGFTRLRPAEEGGSHIVALEGEYGVTAEMDIAMDEPLTDVNAGMLPASSVTGVLFHDLDDDGLRGQTEPGMTAAQVRLLSADGEIDILQTVGEDGVYFFDGVMPGEYTLSYVLPEHCEMARVADGGNTVAHNGLPTVSDPFTVVMGQANTRPMAGAVTLGSFAGAVVRDSNANGMQDGGEPALSGAVITLTPARSGLEAVSATSLADGSFAITGLRPADYTVTIALPDGYIFSCPTEALPFEASGEQTLPCAWDVLTDRAVKLIGAVQPASISGVIWLDEDKNGTRSAEELLLSGVEMELVDQSSGALASAILSTDAGFTIPNVRPGVYTVRFALPQQSFPAQDAASIFQTVLDAMQQTDVVVAEGDAVSGLATGLVSQTSVGGTVWLDENGTRTPVQDVAVSLYGADLSAPVQTVRTDENGSYRFDGLWPDSYTVAAVLPQGAIFVRPDDPNYDAGASVITHSEAGKGTSDAFVLQMAQHRLEDDIILIKPATVGDQAWLDADRNGLMDGGEPMLAGVTVRLLQNGQAVYETVTGAGGYYLFDDVYPGEYVLEACAYEQLSPTSPVPELRIISSCLTSGSGSRSLSDSFRVESGSFNFDFDLGFILTGGTLPAEATVPAPERDWSMANGQDTAWH